MRSKPRESYLKKRGSVYWFRLAVPEKLRGVLNRGPRIEETLRTGDLAEANRLKHGRLDYWLTAFKLAQRRLPKANGAAGLPEHMRDAEAWRTQYASTHHDPNDVTALLVTDHAERIEARQGTEHAQEFARHAFRGDRATLREAFDAFIAGDSLTLATRAKYTQVFDEFMGRLKRPLVGPEEVTRRDADAYVSWINVEAISAHRKPLAYRSKDERVRLLRQLWRHLQQRGSVPHGANLWEGHRITGKHRPERDGMAGVRQPFTEEEIPRILTGPEVGIDAGNRHTTYTKARLLDFYALSLWMGCRIEELCNRTLADVQPMADGGYLFDINRSKTPAGLRKLPVVHPIPVGVLQRVIGARTGPSEPLFPFCLPGGIAGDDRSHYAVKALSRYTRAMGFGRERTFHSARGSFYTRCIALDINADWRAMYCGHELNAAMAKHYAGKAPGVLLNVAKAFTYPEHIEAVWRAALGIKGT
jgi:integrase